jgi:RNA-directed DNA polymerase
VAEAKEDFKMGVEEMLRAVHHKGYPSPPIRRVYIPKPGKMEKRPLGIPCVADRALQRESVPSPIRHLRAGFSTLFVGGRPDIGAHHALATLNEGIAGKSVSGVLEADLKNFFGSLDHGWLLRFIAELTQPF